MDATLVTGGTGLIGFNVIQALLRRGRPVKALVRSAERGRALLPKGVKLAQGDVRDAESVAGQCRAAPPCITSPGCPNNGCAIPPASRR